MKVAFASPLLLERDGIGAYARELCRHLSSLCRLEHLPLDQEIHDRAHYRGLAEAANRCDLLHVEHAHPLFKLPFYPFREAWRGFLRRVAVPRLVVYHEPLESVPVPPRPAHGAGIPWRERGKAALLSAVGPVAERVWLPAYNREILSLPERVVVHTAYREKMLRRFAPEARIRVLPHPVYDPHPVPAGGIDLPFDRESILLTLFGFIDRRKDYPGVLEALCRLPPRYKLLVAGGPQDDSDRFRDGSPYARMMEAARELGVSGRLHVTGFCPEDQIPAIMDASQAVLAPFLGDHSSGSIQMGIAYGRPVLAYRTALTEEMNRNGAGLILVDGREDLAAAVVRTCEDPAFAAEAVRLGEKYRERNSFRAAAATLLGWYRELAGRS
ncbi:MAG: hypothetical protein Kow00128_16340 [Deltaproteobacteria bacterium]